MRPPIELMKTMRPRAPADQRQHRLGHRDLGGQVDLELAAEVVQRQRLQRPGDGDAGVVDEAVEAAPGLGADPLGGGGDLLGDGDVEEQRAQPRRAGGAQRLGVLLLANPGEDLPAGGVEAQRGGAADAGRGAGYEHGSHIARLLAEPAKLGADDPEPGRRGAQAGDGPVRRRQRLDGPRRGPGPGGVAQDHAALLLDPGRRGDRVRGHRRQVHRRRDHGRLRRPDRPRGPRAAGLLRRPADARRRRRVRGRAAPRAGAQLLDPDRDQLRRGGRRGDRPGQRQRATRRSATRSAWRSGWRRWPSPAGPT